MNKWCILAFALSFPMLLHFLVRQNDKEKSFHELLSKEQLEKSKNIKKERLNIFLISGTAGIIAGIVYYFMSTKKSHSKKFCFATVLGHTVCMLSYHFIPKSDYMVKHLTTPAQIESWWETYEFRQHTQLTGFLIGTISIIISSKMI